MSKNEKPQPDFSTEAKAVSSGITPEKAETQTFSLEKLRKHCRKLFNISTAAFDGAAYELSGDFTIDEMNQIIKAWGDKPIGISKEKEGK